METALSYKTDVHRKLCIRKDLIELSQWIDILSNINEEVDYLKLIEKQLLKNNSINVNLQGLRRKNTLLMGMLCKYEQELNTEYEYGKNEYNLMRAKEHEKRRDVHAAFIQEFTLLKREIYILLTQYQRK
ncbi:hypothetical protein BC962_1646 [Gillisia mitskevichiae]|uniref:Uncharacterized protein n=1 Tax=Gillisia mitskevichiae TaxID=270921 RepID=A0A495PTU9_9FLAO|nr:hypothetical protein [Gillisia mitskevichiae]RKS53396.1 hypothetical protein BC962_1646 [Gillisia mitskevichiae]